MKNMKLNITGFCLILFLIITAAAAEAGTKTFPTGTYIIPQDLCWQPTRYYPDSPRPITVELCGNSYDDDLDGTIDEANATSGAISITFAATGKTITRSSGSFLTNGFTAVGSKITTDSTLNPGPFTITTVTATVITVAETVVDEGSVTKTVTQPYSCYDLTLCDTNKNDQGFFQATGLIYEILNAGYPVYWVINPNKTDQIGVDASITKSGTNPAVTILHSPKTDSGTKTPVEYRGGPFIIDANDYDSGMQILFDKYQGSTGTNGVKIHKSNYDFSAEVDKVLSGKPPDVAVLGEGSVQVLTDYLFASGLANQQAVVFKYVTTSGIIANQLDNYQLMWAPHWEIDGEVPVVADRTSVLGKIRFFLEKGNAGFFECASIESLERAYDVSKGTTAPSQYYTGQGILLDKNYNHTNGRIQTNGGTQDYNKIKLEKFTNVLTQCGGWRYNTTGGHVHNLRPSEIPDPDYVYNATVDRFIHDDETRTDLGYAGQGYDYYLGGRINGSATQGYVAYLAGHKYIKCSNTTTSSPSARFFEIDFTAAPSLVSNTIVYVEAVYSGCIAGSTCPRASFDINAQTGTYSTDGTLFVDLDAVEYAADADPATKYTMTNVIIGNKNTTMDKTLTAINVTFSGNTTSTLLTEIRDVTLTSSVVCTPNSPTPASCPSIASKKYDFNFDAALVSSTSVAVKVVYGGCTTGCPTGTYDIATGVGTNGGDGTISMDMSGVTYDLTNKKLKGVAISNLSTASQTLDRFTVTFSGNGTTKLTTVQDVTLTPTTVCTSNETSAANCPPATATSVNNPISFEFASDFTSGGIEIEVVHAGCAQGSTCSKVSATAGSGNPTGWTVVRTDGMVNIGTSAATFNHSTKKLENVVLTSLTGSAITVTKFYILIGADKKLKKIKDGNGNTLYSNPSGLDVNPGQVVTLTTTTTLAVSTQTLNITLAASSPLSITLAKALTQCDIDWSKANACGIKYVLNTLIGLQFQIIPHEYNKAGAIQQDNILYKGAFEYPGYKGHLYSIDVKQNPAYTNWDAGYKNTMPKAGTTNNPATPANNNTNRYIFTNRPGTTTQIGFDVANAGTLQTDTTQLWHYLDPDATNTLNGVKALINSVRGRKNASDASIYGDGEVNKRLGGIEHSSPAVMTRSRLAGGSARDRVVFVGAHDGMLHAFYAGTWDNPTQKYSMGTGKEIWAYIPSTLLGSLQNMTFTDCNPGETITGGCDPLTDPNGCVCPIFSVAVTVDGSPALGDFFVDHDNNPSTVKQWRTIVVATAKVMTPGASSVSVNQGIIFALDVTDPYSPSVLWERTYNAAVDTSVSPGNTIKRNYYPSSTFTTTYTTGEDTSFDPNMGDAKGVAIGRVQVGTTLDTYVFLTSRWVRQVDVSTTGIPHNVWGLSVYALDFYSGDIKWETKIVYTGDAEGVNEPPATPALLDYGNNGTYDYVVVGDMQGRLWVLKTIDGKTIIPTSSPYYPAAYIVGNGAKEPIGAPVALYNNTIIFGTGGRDSLQDESTTPYHLYAIEINSAGEVALMSGWPYTLQNGEKVWSAPVVDDNGTVYLGTAIGYTDVGRPDMMAASSGRLLAIVLTTGQLKKASDGTTDMAVNVGGAVVGDIAIEDNHVTLQLFDGTTVQVGASADSSFASTGTQTNPVKVLWWRKL